MKNALRFSRSQRLVNKADFKSIFEQPYKVSHRCFLALYRPNNFSRGRLGIIVAKRNVKHAADRNVIKRIIRERFRQHQEQLKGMDIIVIGRQQCGLLDKATLREGIDKLWEKLQIHYQSLSLSS